MEMRRISAGRLRGIGMRQSPPAAGDFRDPGPYANPPGTVARRVSSNPAFGSPVRRSGNA